MRFIPGKLFAIMVIVDESEIEGIEMFDMLLCERLCNCVNVFTSDVMKFVEAIVEMVCPSFETEFVGCCCCTTTGVKVTDFELGRVTGVRVTEPIVFELEVVLGMFKQAVFTGTGVNVTDGVVVLFPNVVIAEVLTIDGIIPPTVLVTTRLGNAAGGGGGNGAFSIPTISLMFRLVLFPGSTRGGG